MGVIRASRKAAVQVLAKSSLLHTRGKQNNSHVGADPARLPEAVAEMARRHRIPGAQFGLHLDGHTLLTEVGELGRGRGPVTRATAFPIGSVGKAVTAAAALVLVADGELDPDGPLGRYLPELGAGSPGGRLTLTQVLSHTSGLASSPDLRGRTANATSVRRYVQEQCRDPALVLPAGEEFSYSNIGYVLAGRVIEVVTGMDWPEAVGSIVLRPLGIDPSFVVPPGSGRPVTTGHSVTTKGGRTRPVDQSVTPAEAPAGGLALSAADLVRFGRALLGDPGVPELLPAAVAELMRRPVPGATPFGMADGWALGLAVFRDGPTTWVGHDGTGDGTWCHLRMCPASGQVTALVSNAGTGLDLWEDLVAYLRRSGMPVANRSLLEVPRRSEPPPRGVAGRYLNGDVDYCIEPAGHHRLGLAVDGERQAWLTFHAGMTFSLTDILTDQQIYAGRCLRDPVTGRVDRIQVTGRVARRAISA